MRCLLALALAAAGCVTNDKAGDTGEADRPPSTPEVALDAATSVDDVVVRFVTPSTDPEGKAVAYLYSWTRDGADVAEATSERVAADLTARGETWEVTVVATDGSKDADPTTASVVIGNGPPNAAVVISPAAPSGLDDLVATPNGDDPEGDPVTFTYAWLVDGVDAGIDGQRVSADATARDQVWEVRVTPNDGFDDGAVVTSTVVVGNLPPVLDAVVLVPDPPDARAPITAEPTTSDPDGDAVTVTWAWTVGGAVAQEGPEPSLDPALFVRGDTVSVTGTPSDGLQDGDPLTSAEVVVVNAPPVVVEAPLPAEVTQDDVLVLEPVVVDADGDDVSWTVAWRIDGDPGPDTPELAVDGLPAGTTLAATITPSDDTEDGDAFESATVTVVNTPPRLLEPMLTPDPPTEADLVRFEVDIVDPDGDPLDITYTWEVDGDVVQEGPISSITGALFDRYQTIAVSLEVSDGSAVSTAEAGPVEVENAPPVVEAVELSRDLITERDSITCEAVEPSDADGDEVFLEVDWVVNGFTVDAGEVLDGLWFDRGDEVWCQAEPTDGIVRGDVFESAHLIVQNAAPDAPGGTIVEPAEYRMGLDELRCTLDGAYPDDPDRDLVALRTVWYADGAPIEVDTGNTLYEGDTLLAHATGAGREWSCAFVAYDALYGAEAEGPTGTTATGHGVGGNVLVILMDDVGTDMVGAYAEHPDPPPTPHMDALAGEGVLFRNAYSAPVCSPTRAAMLTGRYGRRYGIGVIVDAWEVFHPLPDSELLIPRVLERSTDFVYDASMAGKWHLGNTIQGPSHPGDMGFGWHGGSMDNLRTPSPIDDGREKSFEMWVKNTNGELAWEDTYATTDSIDDAIARMTAMPEPWFLYVPLNAAHSPVHVPPDHLHSQPVDEDSSEPDMFRAVVEATDTEIGRLLDAIPGPMADRTTVMLIGDNGTPDWAITAPREAPQYKGTLYEGGTNVPFIVRSPHVAFPGSESAALVHVVDVFATTAVLAGVAPEQLTRPDLLGGPDQPVVTDGLSLLPFLQDPDHPSLREYIYTERFADNGEGPYDEVEDRRALRDERWKLMRIRIEGGPVEDRLFDLEGVDVEGENLMAPEALPLSDEAAAAYDRLVAELDALGEELVYDVPAIPPVVRDVVITPEDPAAGDLLTCEVGFFGDLNPDVVTIEYDWAVGDVWLGLDVPVFDSTPAGPGARVQCSATPFDGALYGEPGIAEVVLR